MNKSLFCNVVLIVLCAVVVNSVNGYDISNCADLGAWQAGCGGPGTVACDVPYASGGYCISRCYSNVCSTAENAMEGFMNYVCTLKYSADVVQLGNGEISLAVHRFKSSYCDSYPSKTFTSVPYDREYSEGGAPYGMPK